jgi:xylan 1,4-beta-xylosidase
MSADSMGKIMSTRLSLMTFISLTVATGFHHIHAAATLTVEAATRQGNVPHFWEECIASDHMYLTLNPDVQFALKAVRNECGIKRVRGHGILDDDVGLFHWTGTGSPSYTWAKFDSIMDFLVNNRIDPIVELSFMPHDLASNTSATSLYYGGVPANISAPKDWSVWRNLIYDIVTHCKNRYGAQKIESWYWEVWNEPMLSSFFAGDGNDANGVAYPDDYFRLFDSTLAGALAADSNLKVGGPAAAGESYGSWIDHIRNTGKKASFVSWHAYSGAPGDATADPSVIWDNYHYAVTQIKNSGLPLLNFCTEFGPSYGGGGGDPYANSRCRDTQFGAVYVAKLMKELLDGMNAGDPAPSVIAYWALSDIYEEWYAWSKTVPFNAGFGLITVQGIKKPIFNGYKMLHMMGTTRISLTGGAPVRNNGIDGFATINGTADSLQVLIYNFYSTPATSGNDTVNLVINNIPFSGLTGIRHYRIDSVFSNA